MQSKQSRREKGIRNLQEIWIYTTQIAVITIYLRYQASIKMRKMTLIFIKAKSQRKIYKI